MAATIIDSLIVTLGLDPKNFTEGQKKALASFKKTKEDATATAKEMEARGKQGAQFFGLIKNAAMGLFTLLAGNVVIKAITGIATTTAATGRLASNIGLAAADLQAFTNMVERNGGTADAAAASYKGLADAIAEYKITGRLPEGVQNAMGELGAKGTESPLELVKMFNKYAQGKDVQQANAIGRMLGLDQGSINAALKSVQEFNAELEKSHKLGLIDEGDVRLAKDYQQAIVGLVQAWGAFEKTLATGAMPVIAAVLKAMTYWAVKDTEALKYFFGSNEEPAPQGPRSGRIGAVGGGAEAGKTGRYGTPTKLLDNLERTESGGRDVPGPVIPGMKQRAQGPYQFLPSTAKMLHDKYGYKEFNIHDRQESRDAADFYMQQLLREKGGDLNKAVAAYGGFATQNPAGYQSKVLAGMSSSGGGGGGSSSRTENNTRIGTITIITQATDAGGIARDLASKVQEANRNLALATQASVGAQ